MTMSHMLTGLDQTIAQHPGWLDEPFGLLANQASVATYAAASRLREANLQRELTQDGISTKVAQAFHQLQSYHRQVVLASQAAEAATSSFRRNVRRIQAGEGLPIELVQALQAYAGTLSEYNQAVAACNMAQLDLLYAAGRGISAPSSE